MPTFPSLRTGAIAQYPASREQICATRVLRFIDGAEQRWAEQASSLRRWVIRLDLLDEDEIWRLQQFVQAVAGRSGTFAFTDPWDGAQYPSCYLEDDVALFTAMGEGEGRTELVVRESRI